MKRSAGRPRVCRQSVNRPAMNCFADCCAGAIICIRSPPARYLWPMWLGPPVCRRIISTADYRARSDKGTLGFDFHRSRWTQADAAGRPMNWLFGFGKRRSSRTEIAVDLLFDAGPDLLLTDKVLQDSRQLAQDRDVLVINCD